MKHFPYGEINEQSFSNAHTRGVKKTTQDSVHMFTHGYLFIYVAASSDALCTERLSLGRICI